MKTLEEIILREDLLEETYFLREWAGYLLDKECQDFEIENPPKKTWEEIYKQCPEGSWLYTIIWNSVTEQDLSKMFIYFDRLFEVMINKIFQESKHTKIDYLFYNFVFSAKACSEDIVRDGVSFARYSCKGGVPNFEKFVAESIRNIISFDKIKIK